MRKLLSVGALGVTATAIAIGLLFLAAHAGPEAAHANHAVTVGLDMVPSGTPANTATSLGSIEDCVEVTAGPYNDDLDGATDEDPIGNANFDGYPGVAGTDDDGDTLIDEDSAGFEPGDPSYSNDLADDDDEDGSIDEDPPGQLFEFDVYVTGIGHNSDPGLRLFTIPVLFDDAVMNIASVDVNWFLQQGVGSNVFNTSDTQLPDPLDGWVDIGGADLGTADDKGTGVLARVTGIAVAPGVSTIEMPTVDRDGDTVLEPGIDRGPLLRAVDDTWIMDSDGNEFFEGSVIGATVAVDDSLACNPDWDGDTVLNQNDNCPNTANPGQQDMDADTIGDACDSELDGDGHWNSAETTKGSNPSNASSTPEVCDGVDNDLDTTIDEPPTGANWNIDGDGVKDCLDSNVDTDGDGAANTVDTDDDGDGFSDLRERYMSSDALGNCSSVSGHDAYPSDVNGDGKVLINDVILLFLGKILNPPNYSARSDANADGQILINDVILTFLGKVLTRCTVFTFTNNTGGSVDDMHIVWSTALPTTGVFSARDSNLAGWSERTLSGDGLTLDIARPDAQGDLANGGQLIIVVAGSNPVTSTCQWTLDGVNKGAC